MRKVCTLSSVFFQYATAERCFAHSVRINLARIVDRLLRVPPIASTNGACMWASILRIQKLLRKARIEHDSDFLKGGIRVLSQALMELHGVIHTLDRTHTSRPRILTR
jgi:hypothetical protein